MIPCTLTELFWLLKRRLSVSHTKPTGKRLTPKPASAASPNGCARACQRLLTFFPLTFYCCMNIKKLKNTFSEEIIVYKRKRQLAWEALLLSRGSQWLNSSVSVCQQAFTPLSHHPGFLILLRQEAAVYLT